MTQAFRKAMCRLLAASLLSLSFQGAQAGLIGAEHAAEGAPPTQRAQLLVMLERAEVRSQLQAAGLDPHTARERVRTMSDDEVRTLVTDMQSAPAGAMSNWGWAALVLVTALVWYYAVRK